MQYLCRTLPNSVREGGGGSGGTTLYPQRLFLLESTVTIPNLVRRIHELGYDAVGLADHNITGGHGGTCLRVPEVRHCTLVRFGVGRDLS